MLIAHISDSHIQEPGTLAHGRYDTCDRFARALGKIATEWRRPDFLLHTGDLTHHGDVAVYRHAKAMLDGTGVPYAVMPGNHEDTGALREAFADSDWMPAGPFLHYVIDHFPVRMICLDTTIAGRMDGQLCTERMAWLATCLAEAPDKPTLIAMHHPPFRVGSGSIPAFTFGGDIEFAALLSKYPNVSLVVAGHVHCALQARIGHAAALTVPSASFQFAIERRADKPFSLIDEPPGYYLHDWSARGGFTSQCVLVGDFPLVAPVPRPTPA